MYFKKCIVLDEFVLIKFTELTLGTWILVYFQLGTYITYNWSGKISTIIHLRYTKGKIYYKTIDWAFNSSTAINYIIKRTQTVQKLFS